MRDRVLALALIVALPLVGCQPSGDLVGRTISIENEALLSDPSVSVSIGDLAQGDQRILLNFWGSWCVPCREE
ncbi:MAG: TlpA family protein disulfide reductase, partial [Candidatus Limnocylindrus sp.]